MIFSLVSLNNPPAPDVIQAQREQPDAESPEDNKIESERHNMSAVDRAVENIDAVGYR
jgi:hypothetical protein